MTPGQLRSRRFVAPFRGVRMALGDQAQDLPGDVHREAALLAAKDGAVLCDLSAAAHLSLPLPPWLPERRTNASVKLAVAAGLQRPRHAGISGRRLRLPSEHVVLERGVLVTIPSRTWIDCAPLIPLEHLVAMGDHILRTGLHAPEDLSGIVAWGRGRRGIVAARAALDLLDADAESPGESVARCLLIFEGIPRPVCNANVYDGTRWIARVDMAWFEERVALEYDGAVHLEERQRRRDARRRNMLQQAGWLVITITSDDLRTPRRLSAMVRDALRSRSSPNREWPVVVGFP